MFLPTLLDDVKREYLTNKTPYNIKHHPTYYSNSFNTIGKMYTDAILGNLNSGWTSEITITVNLVGCPLY